MKPSHITTPRTLSECTWVQGYPIITGPVPRGHRIVAALQTLLVLAVFAGIGILLAWRG